MQVELPSLEVLEKPHRCVAEGCWFGGGLAALG